MFLETLAVIFLFNFSDFGINMINIYLSIDWQQSIHLKQTIFYLLVTITMPKVLFFIHSATFLVSINRDINAIFGIKMRKIEPTINPVEGLKVKFSLI